VALVPVHWGTFNLGIHAWNDPPEQMLAAIAGRDVRWAAPRPGEWVDIDAPPPQARWWLGAR
jgi:hypothetical protein